MAKIQHVILTFILAIGISLSCYAAESQSAMQVKQSDVAREFYVPGMGEFMGATQMRHSKLWFAGNAKNWELAGYELDEIEEGLNDAVKYHPVFKNDAPIATILEKFTAQPIRDTRAAIEIKDRTKFKKSFNNLTVACNGCHRASGLGFIVIKQPANLAGSFGNQEFAVKKIPLPR